MIRLTSVREVGKVCGRGLGLGPSPGHGGRERGEGTVDAELMDGGPLAGEGSL